MCSARECPICNPANYKSKKPVQAQEGPIQGQEMINRINDNFEEFTASVNETQEDVLEQEGDKLPFRITQ
jgi:hypothetical protein